MYFTSKILTSQLGSPTDQPLLSPTVIIMQPRLESVSYVLMPPKSYCSPSTCTHLYFLQHNTVTNGNIIEIL